MYKIGELSRLSHIPVKTLRYYDSEGLLVPDEIDRYTGYRYYSPSKLSDCYRILALKELGFTLEEIRTQSAMSKEELYGLIAAKEQEWTETMSAAARHIKILRQLSSALQEDHSMFNIIIKKDHGFLTAFRRLIIEDSLEITRITEEMRGSLPKDSAGSRTLIIDYETEYHTGPRDMGFGVEIAENTVLSGAAARNLTIKYISFPGETACLICRQDELEEARTALNNYIRHNHYQIIGASYRIVYGDGTTELKIPVWKLSEKAAPENDSLDLPFENDPRVIGKWLFADALPSREQFHPHKIKTLSEHWPAKELYFLPGGEKYWIYGWTRGYLLTSCGYPRQEGVNPYRIEIIDGETWLFAEMKTNLYFLYGGKPEIWVYKKADSREYSRNEIMIKDEIPHLPATDPAVTGKWEACAYAASPEHFRPDTPGFGSLLPEEALFWKSAEFLEGGCMKNSFRRRDGGLQTDPPELWRWVNGSVIGIPRSTVSIYLIKEYNGIRYLFVQWKSGDYSYGGIVNGWYVFRFCSGQKNQAAEKAAPAPR